jgi:hypothetical protein
MVAVAGGLALAQLRHRPARYSLLALGIALAVALPVVARASAGLVAGRTLVAAIGALPVGERSLVVSYGGTQDPARQVANDALVRAQLGRLTAAPVRREMLFGALSDGRGQSYRLGAADRLAQTVRLTSGRLPAPCTPTRCEVLMTGPGPAPHLDPGLGIVVVGTGVRSDPLLLPGTFDPGPGVTLLLADGADAAERLSSLTLFPRSSGWVGALDPARIAAAGVPAYTATSREVADDLDLLGQQFVLTAPDDALAREDARAALSTDRLAVLGSAGAVLVLGLALVAGAGLRREHGALVGLLRRRGASRATVTGLTVVVAAVTVAAGTAVGLVLGALTAAAVSGTDPVSAPPLTVAVGAAAGSLSTVAALALAATAATVAVLLWPESSRSTAWHTVEAAAAVAIAVAVVAASRGAVTTSGAAAADPLLSVLPALTALAGGLIAARLWPIGAAALSRRLPARAVASRLAVVGAVRRPLAAVTTVGFLTAAVASVAFAGAYRATLLDGGADQAAYQVPLAARLLPGPDAASPLDVLAGARTTGTGYPVMRTAVSIHTSATSAVTAQVVGLDPGVLPLMSRWSRTTGDDDAAGAAARIRVPAPVAGIAIPAGARTLTVPLAGIPLQLRSDLWFTAWFSAPDGREAGVLLTVRGTDLVGALPDLGDTRQLTAITLRENADGVRIRLHHVGEGGNNVAVLAGTARLGIPVTDAGPVRGSWQDWSSRTAAVAAQGTWLRLGFQLTGALVIVRPGLSTRPPLRVLADPATATLAGSGPLRLDVGTGPLSAVVVGTLARFPTTGDRFIVVDRSALSAALDDTNPGSGAPWEVWVDGAGTAALTGPPYDRLTVTAQDVVRERIQADPVGQGTAWLLAAGALVALLVGAVALVLLVVSARRDDADELLALESDGVGPATLRRVLFLRAGFVAVPAVLAGVITGLLLARAAATLVAVSGTGVTPVPPLTLAVGGTWTAAALGAGLASALVVAAVAAGRAFRAPWPAPSQEELA